METLRRCTSYHHGNPGGASFFGWVFSLLEFPLRLNADKFSLARFNISITAIRVQMLICP